MAALRAQAQVALGATDAEERRHALEATISACDRAGHLVQQLLTLSRLESGEATAGQALDLSQLARQVSAELAPAALLKRQRLSLEADTAVIVQGNGVLVGALLRNLIDNAIRYSPAGAEILVTIRPPVSTMAGTPTAGAEIDVADSGPGLAPEHLSRLGQRFFRVLGQEADGSGLGWSIVQRIAQVHGAAVRAGRSAELGGLRVQVDWPAS
jgi:two-component system sensor histidine kinase QseC